MKSKLLHRLISTLDEAMSAPDVIEVDDEENKKTIINCWLIASGQHNQGSTQREITSR